MVDRSVSVVLRAQVEDYKRKMGEASSATKRVATEAEQAGTKTAGAFGQLAASARTNGDAWKDAGAPLLAFGAAATAATTAAVAQFATFDAAMSSVQAATMESASNMEHLRDAAMDAGARTQYSATEAAAGVEELAKAGVATADILNGGLDGALDLAASGAIGVGDAAEIAATAMTQFGLEGDQVTHIADLLAAGAGKAQGGVGDLGMALKQAGLVADQTGLSIEETTGGLAAFASAGLIGSDAGTSFKTMLQRLTPQSNEAKSAMEDLGISAYDSQGEFIGLAEFAGKLETAMRDLTPEQRNAAMATIFGSDAVRAANVLYDKGESGIREWISAVDDQGFAAEQAALRMDNLKGDIEGLGGALETAMIGMGESSNGPLREVTQRLTDLVNAFNSMPDGVQGLTGILGGVVGAASLAGGAFLTLSPRIVETWDALGKLGRVGGGAQNALKWVGRNAIPIAGALTAATVALTLWAEESARTTAMTRTLGDTLSETGDTSKETAGALRDLMKETRGLGPINFDSVYDEAEKMGIAFNDLTDYVLGNADAIDRVNAAGDEFISGSNPWEHIIMSREGAVQNLRYSLDTMAGSLTTAERQTLQVARAEEEAKGTTDELAVAAQEQAAASEAAAEALQEWRDAAGEADASFLTLTGALDGAIQKNQDYATSTADATEDSGDSWEDYYDGVTVSAADYIAQLQSQVDAQTNWETNMLGVAARVKAGMTGAMLDAGNAMVDELLAAGPEGAAAVALINSMTDEEFAKTVELWGNRGADSVAEFTARLEAERQPEVDVTVNVDADPAPADRSMAAWGARLTAQGNAQVPVDADTSSAQAAYDSLMTGMETSTVTVPILSETSQAVTKADEFVAYVDSTSPMVKCDADTGAGYVTVGAFEAWVLELDPEAKVGASTDAATGAVNAFVTWSDGTQSEVQVDASTGTATTSVTTLLNETSQRSASIEVKPATTNFWSSLLGAIAGKSVTVPVTAGGSAARPAEKRTGGGQVRGPGTTTSDSIPALISDQEWVIQASSANKYGPEFMTAVNQGTYDPGRGYARFRDGGRAGGTTRPVLTSPSSPTIVNVNVPEADSSQLAVEFARQLRIAAQGAGAAAYSAAVAASESDLRAMAVFRR